VSNQAYYGYAINLTTGLHDSAACHLTKVAVLPRAAGVRGPEAQRGSRSRPPKVRGAGSGSRPAEPAAQGDVGRRAGEQHLSKSSVRTTTASSLHQGGIYVHFEWQNRSFAECTQHTCNSAA